MDVDVLAFTAPVRSAAGCRSQRDVVNASTSLGGKSPNIVLPMC